MSMTGSTGHLGESESMLVGISITLLSLRNRPGLSRTSCGRPLTSICGNVINRLPMNLVVLLAKLLPRCGVPIVMTRRTEGFGWKKNVDSNPSRTSSDALTVANGFSLTMFQKSLRLSSTCSFDTNPPMLCPTRII